jgi:hypothetical protein
MPWGIIAVPAVVFLILGIISGLKEKNKIK